MAAVTAVTQRPALAAALEEKAGAPGCSGGHLLGANRG